MGDYLVTRVKECVRHHISTSLVLKTDREDHIEFDLPISVDIYPGSRVVFYQGTIRGVEDPCITHEDYFSVEVFRRGRQGKSVMRFPARDMRFLSQVHGDYNA